VHLRLRELPRATSSPSTNSNARDRNKQDRTHRHRDLEIASVSVSVTASVTVSRRDSNVSPWHLHKQYPNSECVHLNRNTTTRRYWQAMHTASVVWVLKLFEPPAAPFSPDHRKSLAA